MQLKRVGGTLFVMAYKRIDFFLLSILSLWFLAKIYEIQRDLSTYILLPSFGPCSCLLLHFFLLQHHDFSNPAVLSAVSSPNNIIML